MGAVADVRGTVLWRTAARLKRTVTRMAEEEQ